MVRPLSAERPRLPLLMVVGALVSVAAISAVGASGSTRASGVALLASGIVPVVFGLVVVVIGTSAPRACFRVVLGAAAVVWGLGQVVLGLQSARAGFAPGSVPMPSEGDAVGALAAPLALVGLALLPRRSDRPFERTRLALDAAVLGGIAAMVVWELVLRSSHGGSLARVDAPVLAVVVLDLVVLSSVVTTAVRERDRGILVASAGVLLLVVSDVVQFRMGVADRPWAGSVATCLAWTLLVLGFGSVTPPDSTGPQRHDSPAAESRRLLLTTSASIGVVGLLGASFLLPRAAGTRLQDVQVTVLLGLGVLVLLWVREGIRARQSRLLLEKLSEQAMTDVLTGLGNRRALTAALAAHEVPQTGLVVFDLDGFRDVNRTLGHTAADTILVEVARAATTQAASVGGTAHRLAGDQFAVLAGLDEEATVALAEALLDAVRDVAESTAGLGRIPLSASVGAVHLGDTDDEDRGAEARLALLDLAVLAMREAKASGRDRVTLYGEDTAARARRRDLVESRLREVVRDGGIAVHYQPVIDLNTGTVTGVEGLVRWDDAVLGKVPPLEFIGIAEDAGLMPELGLRILEEGLSGFVASGAAGRGATLGMNFSTLQLRMPGYAALVVERVRAAGVRPQQLVVEVTESVLLNDADPAADAVYHLAAAGMPIALDDFGTGYSSLAYLHQLPVSVLKLDRTMVLSMDTDRGLAIVRAILMMAGALGLDVVAEGIETPSQAAQVRGLDIPYVQGWLFSRAVDHAGLKAFVDEHGTRIEALAQRAHG